MIGAGVFTTSGFSLGGLGDRQYVMLAWLVGGVIAICGAISYGQLAQRITESGGEYLFLSRLVHPAVGFVAGWVSLLAGFTSAIAFAAITFESYAVPDSVRSAWLQPGMIGIATIVSFGILHSTVLRMGVTTQNVVVVLKLVFLTGFIVFAFSSYPKGWVGMAIQTDPVPFSIYTFASALVWISLSYSGFNAAVYITGEVDNPNRNVPRALLLGTLITLIFYFALNFIFLYASDPDSIRNAEQVAAVASGAIGGDGLAILIRVIISFALLSSVSSMVLAGPRVYAKMADDGVFPKLFNSSRDLSANFLTENTADDGNLVFKTSRIASPSERDQGTEADDSNPYVAPQKYSSPIERTASDVQPSVPVAAIWLQVILAATVTYFSTLKSLLDYLGFTLSVSAAITVACILWTKRASDTTGQRVLFTVIASIYVSATIVLAALSAIGNPWQLIGFAITVGSGLALYYAIKVNKAKAGTV